MTTHTEMIYTILNAITSYTGGYFPDTQGVQMLDDTEKFFVAIGEQLLIERHWYSEQYKITLQASSEANLHTLKNALLDCATDRPGGYAQTDSTYPYWIGFTSPNHPRHMGPNIYTMDLTLLASYEVTS